MLRAVISRRFYLGQKLVALAPLLLLVVSLPSQMLLRCRIDGSVRAACCCPGEPEQDPSTTPTVKAQSCCDQEIAISEARIMELPPPAHPDVVIATSRPATLLVAAPEAGAVSRAFERGGPAREGPPLVLVKQSFLI
jgi:hypothetical protein